MAAAPAVAVATGDGTALFAIAEGPVFESAVAERTIGQVSVLERLQAAGPVVRAGSAPAMVPIRPVGFVQARGVRVADGRLDGVAREVHGLLDELCSTNRQLNPSSIVERAVSIEFRSATELEILVSFIVAKTLSEPHFSNTSADIVSMLMTKCPEFPPGDEGQKKQTFVRILLNLCQDEFESLPDRLDAPGPSGPHVEAARLRAKAFALVEFIGNLFLRQLIPLQVIGKVVHDLIGLAGAPDLCRVDMVCALLLLVGPRLDVAALGRTLMSQFAHRLRILCLDTAREVPKRTRSAIQDVLELRQNGWTWASTVVVQLEEVPGEAGVGRIQGRSLAGERCVVIPGRLSCLNDHWLRMEVAQQMAIHPKRLRVVMPSGAILE